MGIGVVWLAAADVILQNGRIVTLDVARPRAAAVAIAGDRLTAVGSDREIAALRGPKTRVVDLGKRTVVPGLVDAHGHLLSFGQTLETVDLRGTRSAEEVVRRVRRAAPRNSAEWILGRGWDQNDWPRAVFPHRRLLDAALPGRAVLLTRIDGHAVWASSEALRRAGIDARTPDPPGGRIVREGGEPGGVLVDNAADLVEKQIPRPDATTRERRLRAAIDRCVALGLTGVHDMGVDGETADVLRRLAATGQLKIRVYAVVAPDEAEAALSGKPEVGPTFTRRAVKLYADGALGSRGAALLEDYRDDPGNRGLDLIDRKRLVDLARRAHARGWQVAVHAIGDRANRTVLDAFEEALGPELYAARFRIEHAQVVSPADLLRFAHDGVIASMQPTHATSDMPWAEQRLGPERIRGAYAWRTLLRSGARLAFGSDFPIEEVNPLLGLYAAVTRQDADGRPKGGWYPAERLTAEEALRAFTTGAAYAAFAEDERGTIKPGMSADLTVLDGPVLDVDPRTIRKRKVVATMVAGRFVYGPTR
jgi:predicted amidohydrolase YtcJ